MIFSDDQSETWYQKACVRSCVLKQSAIHRLSRETKYSNSSKCAEYVPPLLERRRLPMERNTTKKTSSRTFRSMTINTFLVRRTSTIPQIITQDHSIRSEQRIRSWDTHPRPNSEAQKHIRSWAPIALSESSGWNLNHRKPFRLLIASAHRAGGK